MEVQLTKFTVTLKDRLGWGDDEIIKAEMMSALRVSAEMKKQVDEAAKAADAAGKPMGSDPFNLNGLQMDGQAILAARIKAAELSITKIVDSNGQVIAFTQDWLYNLSKADGQKVMLEVDKLRREVDDGEAVEAAVEGK
jgi:hypothetical protein